MINIFDMMGPVMVGPSSSHTAGAARIGNMGRTLLGEEVARADIGLHGSFAETGFGHGTDRALLAGLLGMKPDDLRIPNAYEEANRAGMAYSFRTVELRDAHPNTALLELTGKSGKKLTLQASSIRGGTNEQIGHAVAIALKNLMGLVCDPVAGLVEVPCVKRNVIGAVNAISAADMALAGIESRIPVDEVIDAMGEVGRRMPVEFRETALGGLAATPTGKAVKERMPHGAQ